MKLTLVQDQAIAARMALIVGADRFIGISDAAFVRAEGLSSGPEQRKLALETALADVSALKAA
jgi:FMN-dependent NADH-azoreductase